MASLPFGLQHNNPGNMRPTGDHWLGMAGEVEGFLAFVDMKSGYRALLKNCINAIAGGYNTIEKFVTHYAPPSENDTNAYIDYVSKTMGLGPQVRLRTDESTIKKLVYAISYHEQGVPPSNHDIDAGWSYLTGVKVAEAGGLGVVLILALIYFFR